MMNAMELDFYEAGIKDAYKSRCIVVAACSERYAILSKKYNLRIGKQSVQCVKAYNNGVAYEINRQTKLEV